MAQQQFKLSVAFAWWLKPYLSVLAICCILSGNVPDQVKLQAQIKRAMRVIVE
jgi:hypothetical protein